MPDLDVSEKGHLPNSLLRGHSVFFDERNEVDLRRK